MKVYTKAGDKGHTSLVSGKKVSKASLRIDAYGSVDELNAHLALLRDHLHTASPVESLQPLADKILTIQHELFEIGSELATPPSSLTSTLQASIDGTTLSRLEQDIDLWQEALPPLRNFVIPGGHPFNAYAHIARCVARRAEREVVRLHEQEAVRPEILQYLNRLSDWLFVLSRTLSARLGCPETLWKRKPV